ncbi:hypothetical protein D3C78_1534490 [compost metagenome]
MHSFLSPHASHVPSGIFLMFFCRSVRKAPSVHSLEQGKCRAYIDCTFNKKREGPVIDAFEDHRSDLSNVANALWIGGYGHFRSTADGVAVGRCAEKGNGWGSTRYGFFFLL